MIEKKLQIVIREAAKKIGVDVELSDIVIETSKDSKHGDYATNIAMQLARSLKTNPREVATRLLSALDASLFAKLEIAGPGFINFFLKPTTLTNYLPEILNSDENYGNGDPKHLTVNIEFVSANPTGKLHLGHARGAAVGDVLARLFKKSGYQVIKEFYVNDAGVQINNLAISLYTRYLNLLGVNKEMPDDGYFSDDLITLAEKLVGEVGNKYQDESAEGLEFFKLRGSEILLDIIKEDLNTFRVNFDVYSYETAVRSNNAVENLLGKLEPFTYVDDGAVFLNTSKYGDDKDRVIVKRNGEYTYFLPDIVYHLDKLSRDASLLIDVLGADHHGYIGRMKAALQMFNHKQDILEVQIIQLVRIIKDGQELKMSKRTGNAITLEELVEEVGVDAARYFFIAKSASSHFDFDLNLASERSNANPVFYAQYAHARLCGAIKKGEDIVGDANHHRLVTAEELSLMKQLIAYPGVVKDATDTREPYKVANYIQKLASLIHTFYTEARIVDPSNLDLSSARLALANGARIILKDALNLLGVNAPTSM